MPKISESQLYRRVLPEAWRAAWHHKHLWLFGFFATFAGFGSVSEVFFRAYGGTIKMAPEIGWAGAPWQLLPGLATVKTIIAYSPFPAIAAALFIAAFLLILAVFVWFTVVSVGALLASAASLTKGGDPHFAEGIRLGAPKFWSLFAVLAASKIVIWAGAAVSAVLLYALMRGEPFLGALFLPVFIATMAVSVVVAVLAVFACLGIVVDGKGISESVGSGWKTFRGNWLISLETAALLLLVSLGIGAAGLLAALVISVPFIILFFAASVLQAGGLVAVLTGTAVAAILLLVVGIGSFMTTFQTLTWTFVWKRMSAKGAKAWVVRAAERLGWHR
jgi:hypothetical protein